MRTDKPLIAKNLAWLLEKAETNPNALSKAIGNKENGKPRVPQATIHRIIEGQHTSPRMSTLEPIAKHFKVKVSDLLEWDFPKNGRPHQQLEEPKATYRSGVELDPDQLAWLEIWDQMIDPEEREEALAAVAFARSRYKDRKQHHPTSSTRSIGRPQQNRKT